MGEKILVVNPGSTSTKMALFEGPIQQHAQVVRYDSDVLDEYTGIWQQFDRRTHEVRLWIHALAERVDAVVSIGGLLRPLCGGTYLVNERMLQDARVNLQGEHASNLGCAMSYALAKEYQCPAYVVDPVSVDEMTQIARYSGHPLITRKSLSHALNLHAAARRAADDLNLPLKESSLVVAHLGGGISVAPILGGRILDVNDASSDGPFSPERTGGLPLQDFITLCFSGVYSESEVRHLVMGKGGLMAYLGTNSGTEVERRIRSGDSLARDIYEAMAYQIAKEIGAMAVTLYGVVHAVVLTGGLAGSRILIDEIRKRVKSLGPVFVYPDEDEMKSLACGALRVLRHEEQPLEY